MVLEAHATSYEGMEKCETSKPRTLAHSHTRRYDLAIEILQLSRQFIRTHIGANSAEV